MGIGEEVEEVERAEAPTRRGQPARVAGEGYGIAGEEANLFVRLVRDGVDHVAPGTGAWRMEEEEVGARLVIDPMFDRRLDQLHVRGGVALRGCMGWGGSATPPRT